MKKPGPGAQEVAGEVAEGLVVQVGEQDLAHGPHDEEQHEADDHVDEDDGRAGQRDGLAGAHEQSGADRAADGQQLDVAVAQGAGEVRFLALAAGGLLVRYSGQPWWCVQTLGFFLVTGRPRAEDIPPAPARIHRRCDGGNTLSCGLSLRAAFGGPRTAAGRRPGAVVRPAAGPAGVVRAVPAGPEECLLRCESGEFPTPAAARRRRSGAHRGTGVRRRPWLDICRQTLPQLSSCVPCHI